MKRVRHNIYVPLRLVFQLFPWGLFALYSLAHTPLLSVYATFHASTRKIQAFVSSRYWLYVSFQPYGGLTPIPPAVEIYPRSTRTTHGGPRRTAKVVVCRTISRANVGSLLSIGVDFVRLHRGISPQLLSFVAPQRAHRWFHRDRLRASRIGRGNAKSWINQTFTALADPVLEKKLAYSNSKLTGMESQRSLVSGSITLTRK